MKETTGKCPYPCGIGAAFAIIGRKWKARIIQQIGEGRPRGSPGHCPDKENNPVYLIDKVPAMFRMNTVPG
jgi:hypothetical protein